MASSSSANGPLLFRTGRSVIQIISTGAPASTVSPIYHSLGGTLLTWRFQAARPRRSASAAHASALIISVFSKMKPIIGRDFAEADDTAGSAPVVLIGETVWRTRFGSSQKVLGQHIVVDGVPREIIGVLPAADKISAPFANLGSARGAAQRRRRS